MRENQAMLRKSLKRRLRRLPQLPVPAGLEERLLDGIPAAFQTEMTGERRFLRPLFLAAAAVLALALVLPPLLPHRTPQGGPPPGSQAEIVQIRPANVLPHAAPSETRSCDILPPLPC